MPTDEQNCAHPGRNPSMPVLDKLERALGRFAVPQLTLALIVCQVAVYGMTALQPRGPGVPDPAEPLLLVPELVLQGEAWRLVSFLVVPPVTNLLFAFLFWYFLYLMGTALEHHWGTFRFNIYLLVGYLATLGAAFIVPDQPAGNGFLYGSLFLAFAYLYPDYELLLFFILPVKVKYLALLAWIGYGLGFLFGDWLQRVLILAALSNFLLFFGRDVFRRALAGHR